MNHWHDPSRAVLFGNQKGQGIGILAPYILKKKITDALNLRSATVGARNISYFDYHVVYVFDKEQTNGIPAPVVAWDLSDSKIDAEAAFNAFKQVAPFVIVFSTGSDFKGNFIFEEGNDDTGRKATLILNVKYMPDYYKLCNFVLRVFVTQSLGEYRAKFSPDEFEKIVECVSFVLANCFGLSTEDYTFFFARTWATNSKNMLEILNAICQCSHKLIDKLEAEMIDYKAQFGNNEDIYAFDDDIFEFENLTIFDV